MPKSSEIFGNNLRPEEKLLVLCARMHIGKDTTEEIHKILTDGIDWECVVQMTNDHNIVPLVYRSLESIASAAIPDTIRAELKRQVQVDVQGNLSLTKELLELLRLFNQQGIRAIPYKGPVLAASVYHDLAVRSFGDIDILVNERDVLFAINLLTSNGYEIIRPLNIAQTEIHLQSLWVRRLIEKSPWAYQVVLWNPERQGIVELHWRLTPRYVFPRIADMLWEDLRPVTLAGDTVYSFAPENLLWLLCLHGTRHRWSELRWLCDIAELIREYPNLNWEKLHAQTRELGVQRRLDLGLFLANYIFNAQISDALKTKIQNNQSVRVLAQEVIDGLFKNQEKSSWMVNFKRLVFQLRSMDRFADRWIYLVRFFKGIDREITTERKLFKRFSFLSLTTRLFENKG
jgi:hypothetical protein